MAVIVRERGSSVGMTQSGMIMAYARAYALYFAKVCKKWLTPPYETQGFAYVTQSYDTTLLKVYSGVYDDAQMYAILCINMQSMEIYSRQPPTFPQRKNNNIYNMSIILCAPPRP